MDGDSHRDISWISEENIDKRLSASKRLRNPDVMRSTFYYKKNAYYSMGVIYHVQQEITEQCLLSNTAFLLEAFPLIAS